MKITKTSPFSGNTNVMEIDVTQEQIALWESGTLIQNAMPHLTPDEREFIMTGITPEVWAQQFPAGPALMGDLWDSGLGTEEIVLTMGS